MAAYSKYDFYDKYRIRLRMWDDRIKAFRRSPISFHYHRCVMEEMVQAHWPKLIELLDITAEDRVIVVGAGYGWGLEKLIELTGCNAVGTDTSAYIQATQDATEEEEIVACIIATGYDPRYGYGKEVMDYTNAVNSDKANYLIFDEALDTEESRDSIIMELGGTPTLIITENILSDFSDIDVCTLAQDLAQFGCSVCHYTMEINRTSEDTAKLTGQRVITVGTMRSIK